MLKGRGGQKRSMDDRPSQQFCVLVRAQRFAEAFNYGKEWQEFIRNDCWRPPAGGGGMVETALFALCGPPQFSSGGGQGYGSGRSIPDDWDERWEFEEWLVKLVNFILFDLGAERYINRPRTGHSSPLSPLETAILNGRCNSARVLIMCSLAIEPGNAVAMICSDPLPYNRPSDINNVLWTICSTRNRLFYKMESVEQEIRAKDDEKAEQLGSLLNNLHCMQQQLVHQLFGQNHVSSQPLSSASFLAIPQPISSPAFLPLPHIAAWVAFTYWPKELVKLLTSFL